MTLPLLKRSLMGAKAPLPPGPAGHFLLGNVLQVRKDPLGFLLDSARTYGNIVRLRFFHQSGYLINHPDDIESILVTQSKNFIKPPGREPSGTSQRLFGDELLSQDGDFWLRHRPYAQPAFHRARIAGYAEVMVARTQQMLATWREAERRDIYQDMMRLTLEVVAQTLFGTDVAGRVEAIAAALDVIMHEITARMVNPLQLPMNIPTPGNLRFRRAVEQLDELIDGAIRQHQAGDQDNGDLLSMLLQARRDDPARVTEYQWRYEVMTLFVAGYETTALALTWSWYLLSQHPEAEARLIEELEAVLGGRAPTAADVPQLPYTNMVLKESLRLYPPVWFLGGRVAVRECQVGGYRMPAGTMLMISPWVTHRDARFFEDPERFHPERWRDEASKPVPKYAYFPFSGGPRHCIGYAFAMMEAVLTLATIAQSFRLRLVPGHPVTPQPLITLRPKHGLHMVVSRRR